MYLIHLYIPVGRYTLLLVSKASPDRPPTLSGLPISELVCYVSEQVANYRM